MARTQTITTYPDQDDYADQVRKMLEREHGVTTREITNFRPTIEQIIFDYWMDDKHPEHAAECVAYLLMKDAA